MDIILYSNSSDPRKLNKTITAIKTISVRLKDDTDVMRPVIELDSANLPPAANYCYIEKFSRYYFINKQGISIGRDLLITLEVDVLMSFKGFINNSTVIAERSSNKFNRYIGDNIPLLSKQNNIFKAFTPFQGLYAFDSSQITAETPCILLTVTKGGVKNGA